ncbi:Copper homeostasis protein CutC, partial [Stegodyphus mimosarum]
MKAVKKFVPMPVHVLIRPRSGDFRYNSAEVWQMVEEVKTAVSLEMDGIVIGALDENRQVDKNICHHLIANAFGLPVTFHRAFDLAADPERALEDIIQLGCSRILTSGQKESAYKGKDKIRELIEK